jgi:hypothetical protein
MQPRDAQLRDGLAVLAEQAGPLDATAVDLVTKVRRRRFVAVAAVGLVVVLGLTAVGWLGTRWAGDGLTPAASPSFPRPFVCGEKLDLGPDASDTRLGLTMKLSMVRKVSADAGPDLAVTFSADRALRVQGSPPRLYELLYLRDGVIVGGGPMLNAAGNMTPQGMNLVGSGFDVSPGNPVTEDLGSRNLLCSGLSWPQIWSQPQEYEAVLVQGRVMSMPDAGPDYVLLDIPTLGYWPLIATRLPLG